MTKQEIELIVEGLDKMEKDLVRIFDLNIQNLKDLVSVHTETLRDLAKHFKQNGSI